jgi:hypothetical protein
MSRLRNFSCLSNLQADEGTGQLRVESLTSHHAETASWIETDSKSAYEMSQFSNLFETNSIFAATPTKLEQV